MTILSKGSLAVERIAVVDDGPCAVTTDGATAGTSRKAAMVVTPLGEDRKLAVRKFLREQPLRRVAVVGPKTLREADKLVGRDTTFKGLLEHCDVADGGTEAVEITVVDGQRVQNIRARKSGKKLDVERLVSAMVEAVEGEDTHTFVVNRKRLKAVLEAIDRACPDTAGSSPVWVTICSGGEVVLRGENRATGQRAWALMSSGKADAPPPLGEWERTIYGSEKGARDLLPPARKLVKKGGKRKRKLN